MVGESNERYLPLYKRGDIALQLEYKDYVAPLSKRWLGSFHRLNFRPQLQHLHLKASFGGAALAVQVDCRITQMPQVGG